MKRRDILPLVCKAAVISIVLLLTGCGGNYSETEFLHSGEISEKLEEGTEYSMIMMQKIRARRCILVLVGEAACSGRRKVITVTIVFGLVKGKTRETAYF